MVSDDELIARYIKEDPYFGDEVEARLADSLMHVWAIVGQLMVNDWDVALTARDYDVPEIEVSTAIAYYKRHRQALDATLAGHTFAPALAVGLTEVAPEHRSTGVLRSRRT